MISAAREKFKTRSIAGFALQTRGDGRILLPFRVLEIFLAKKKDLADTHRIIK